MGTAGNDALQPQYPAYEKQKCFVGHSQHAAWRDDLLSALADVLSQFNLQPWYAAEHFEPTKTLRNKVVELIANARYGIYDLSNWQDRDGSWQQPRNVFIELGMAIALNRPTLLLRHTSNQSLPLPGCFEGLELIEFAGETTLIKTLKARLPHWVNVPPEQDWWNRFCIFGNRKCSFREAHPRAQQALQERLMCHVTDGLDEAQATFRPAERSEIRTSFESIFERYENVHYNFLDELSLAGGYNFRLCSHCQAVRSTPFAVYNITPQTPAEVYITLGMSIALEKVFDYEIPKILLVRQESDLPSLLRGYDVVEVGSSSEMTKKLKAFVPKVIKQVRETVWVIRPLPFHVAIHSSTKFDVMGNLREQELSERISVEKEEYILNKAYVNPIEQLGISTRTSNVLKRTGITKIGELLELLERGEDTLLLAIHDFGPRSLEEVKRQLRTQGFITDKPEEMQLKGQAKKANSAANDIAEDLELRNTLKRIVEAANQVLKADVTYLTPFDNVKYEPLVDMGASAGKQYQSEQEHESKHSQLGLTQLAINDPTGLVTIEKLSDHPDLTSRFAQQEQVRSVAVVRLEIHDRVVGILYVYYRQNHQFDEQEKTILRLLANQAAVAIHNAQLIQQIKQRIKQTE